MHARRAYAATGPHLFRNSVIGGIQCRTSIALRHVGKRKWGDTWLRQASVARDISASSYSLARRAKNFFYGTSIVVFLVSAYYAATDVRFSIHQWLGVPMIRYRYEDAEDAHHAATKALRFFYRYGLHPRERGNPDAAGDLEVEVLGHILSNPIGVSAGLDKGAEIADQLLQLGSAYVEVGGITPLPQEGNPKPRLFRVISQSALINRFGLNSEGCDRVAVRLKKRVREYASRMGYGIDECAEKMILDGDAGVPPGSLVKGKLMGIQIAKNKATPDDVEAIVKDYVFCVEKLARYADVIVVNVSSPNTENLRDLQRQEPLTKILSAVVDATRKIDRRTKPAVLVKVSPDEDSEEQVEGICQAITDSGVDGVIVANTTTRRPPPLPPGKQISNSEAAVMLEKGGLSGPQLFPGAVNLVRRYRRILDRIPYDKPPELPLDNDPPLPSHQEINNASVDQKTTPQEISKTFTATQSSTSDNLLSSLTQEPARKVIFYSGGVTTGQQALEALNAGADLVQVYTALVYGGPGTFSNMKNEMRAEMKRLRGAR